MEIKKIKKENNLKLHHCCVKIAKGNYTKKIAPNENFLDNYL